MLMKIREGPHYLPALYACSRGVPHFCSVVFPFGIRVVGEAPPAHFYRLFSSPFFCGASAYACELMPDLYLTW